MSDDDAAPLFRWWGWAEVGASILQKPFELFSCQQKVVVVRVLTLSTVEKYRVIFTTQWRLFLEFKALPNDNTREKSCNNKMDKRRLERSNTKEMKDWATLPVSPKKVVNHKDTKEVASEKATTPTATNAGTKDDDIPAVAKKYTTKSTFEKQKEEPVTVNKSVMGGGVEDNETSKPTAVFPTTFATTNKSEQQQPLKTTGSMEDRAVEAKRVKEYRDRTKHMITPAHSKDDYSAVPSEADDDDHSFVTRKTDHEFQNLVGVDSFSFSCFYKTERMN
jgi:hypothetical protein